MKTRIYHDVYLQVRKKLHDINMPRSNARQTLISSRFTSPMHANVSNTSIHNPSAWDDLPGILSRSRRKDLLVLRSMKTRENAQDNAKEGRV